MRFEREAPEGDNFALQAAKMFLDCWYKLGLLFGIYLHDGFKNLKIVLTVLRSFRECLHVFREATASVADAWEQESFTDTIVSANSFTNGIHIGAELFAKVGDLIHERNLYREESIGGVLG